MDNKELEVYEEPFIELLPTGDGDVLNASDNPVNENDVPGGSLGF